MHFLRSKFCGQFISCFGDIEWPARLAPDLICNFFCGWALKQEFTQINLVRRSNWKKSEGSQEIANLSPMLEKVLDSFSARLEECFFKEAFKRQSFKGSYLQILMDEISCSDIIFINLHDHPSIISNKPFYDTLFVLFLL